MQRDVLVLAEHKNAVLDGITFQLLRKGRELADQLGVQLKVLILGAQLDALTESLASKGADMVLVADHPLLDPYNPEVYCRVTSEIIREARPSLVLLGHTFFGIEVGIGVAARLASGLVTNCVNLELSDGVFTITRPMYRGLVHVKAELVGPIPHIATLQKYGLTTDTVSENTSSVARVVVDVTEHLFRTKVVSVVDVGKGEVDITKADILVAVGRGIGDKKNVHLAQELANALGGVVACSRPVADMGWLSTEYQVGLSGKTVSPKIYIACGISGAAQHVAGMTNSQIIIAINKDDSAPIFQIAHYGVIGDLFEIVPELMREAST